MVLTGEVTAFEEETRETGAPGASIDPEQQRISGCIVLRLHEVVEELHHVVIPYTHVPKQGADENHHRFRSPTWL